MRAAEAVEPPPRLAERDADALGRLVALERPRVERLVGARPDVEARGARGHDQRLAGRERGRRLQGGALEAPDLARAARDAHRDVRAADVVAEAPGQRLLVERLAREDRPHRLGAELGGAAHHPLALGPVLLDELSLTRSM